MLLYRLELLTGCMEYCRCMLCCTDAAVGTLDILTAMTARQHYGAQLQVTVVSW